MHHKTTIKNEKNRVGSNKVTIQFIYLIKDYYCNVTLKLNNEETNKPI